MQAASRPTGMLRGHSHTPVPLIGEMKGKTMFYKKKFGGYKKVLEGIQRKTLAYGENMLLAEFRLEQGSQLPWHAHVQEQIGYLIAGSMRLTIGDESVEMEPGDSWYVPSNIEHRAEILADSVAIEVFSPVREDYLPGQ
jgi:quercetin dioxygenase-like cupin family protein